MEMTGLERQEVSRMARLLHCYIQYRRVGFTRMAAFRFAWLVFSARVRPAAVTRLAKRG